MTTRHDTLELSWDGARGLAVCSGVSITLNQAPRVTGLGRILEIQYNPHLGRIRIMTVAPTWRDLSPAEMTVIGGWLRRVAFAARNGLLGWDGVDRRDLPGDAP